MWEYTKIATMLQVEKDLTRSKEVFRRCKTKMILLAQNIKLQSIWWPTIKHWDRWKDSRIILKIQTILVLQASWVKKICFKIHKKKFHKKDAYHQTIFLPSWVCIICPFSYLTGREQTWFLKLKIAKTVHIWMKLGVLLICLRPFKGQEDQDVRHSK